MISVFMSKSCNEGNTFAGKEAHVVIYILVNFMYPNSHKNQLYTNDICYNVLVEYLYGYNYVDIRLIYYYLSIYIKSIYYTGGAT